MHCDVVQKSIIPKQKRDRMRSHQYNNNIKINEQKEQWKENKMAVQGLLLTWTFDLD